MKEFTTEFPIEKGVPVTRRTSAGGTRKYPWNEMKVGDSFFVPEKTAGQLSITIASRATGFMFTTRTENGGIRVWRIE